jgi:hypothetical protein
LRHSSICSANGSARASLMMVCELIALIYSASCFAQARVSSQKISSFCILTFAFILP